MDLLPDIIGQSPGFLRTYELAKLVAPTNVNVLISGETGTGKDLFANAIHKNSKREGRPFIIINCAAEPDSLFESELFGHEKGAFTGAYAARVGKLKFADRGTLFLDEIGDMPLSMQSKILRAIDQKNFTPLGQNNPTSSDFRLICATNKNLTDYVANGSFREDLYYRINGIDIELPPLRSRKDDIPLFVEHFTKLACENNQLKEFLPEALIALQQYFWPGNIRQLKNVCERAVILSQADKIGLPDLPDDIVNFKSKAYLKAIKKQLKEWNEKYSLTLQDLDNSYIEVVYESNGRNKSKAAKALGMNRTTLGRRLEKLSLV